MQELIEKINERKIKLCEVKYPTSREEGTVGVRCTRSKSAVFTGFAAGIHEIS